MIFVFLWFLLLLLSFFFASSTIHGVWITAQAVSDWACDPTTTIVLWIHVTCYRLSLVESHQIGFYRNTGSPLMSIQTKYCTYPPPSPPHFFPTLNWAPLFACVLLLHLHKTAINLFSPTATPFYRFVLQLTWFFSQWNVMLWVNGEAAATQLGHPRKALSFPFVFFFSSCFMGV